MQIGLRIITNLSCLYKCRFCYQARKDNSILSLQSLRGQLVRYGPKHFQYCTIMGGESTLLKNLPEYISIGSHCSCETRLTTNGSLLTEKTLKEYKDAGLTGINISIGTLEKYAEVTGSNVDILPKVALAQKFLPVRINIPLCKENMEGEIKELVGLFLSMGLSVTICEDILGTHKALHETENILGAKIVEDTGHGLVFLERDGKRFGYYTHKDNYKNTDLVITPLGTWNNWDGYCDAVGLVKN